ncbi:cytochrome c oxidase-assembly factor COX23 [Spatholobus suberectus]|nr:cytochrome c oxidase-assembly factor COX23 [Spatholobus suberectus]
MASKGSTPPYPSAARIADSQCFPQYTASLELAAWILGLGGLNVSNEPCISA